CSTPATHLTPGPPKVSGRQSACLAGEAVGGPRAIGRRRRQLGAGKARPGGNLAKGAPKGPQCQTLGCLGTVPMTGASPCSCSDLRGAVLGTVPPGQGWRGTAPARRLARTAWRRTLGRNSLILRALRRRRASTARYSGWVCLASPVIAAWASRHRRAT